MTVALTQTQASAYAHNAGFRGSELNTIVGIAGAESGYQAAPTANPTHFGILQFDIPTAQSVGMTLSDVLDPQRAFVGAYRLVHGWNGAPGRGFQPWQTYTQGTYKQFLPGSSSGGSVNPFAGSPNDPFAVNNSTPLLGGLVGAASSLGGASQGVSNAVYGAQSAVSNLGRAALPYVVIVGGLLITGVLMLLSLKG